MKEISKKEIYNLIGEVARPIILDIGTYDGADAQAIASMYHECEVHCFEADPRSIDIFLELNRNEEDLYLHTNAIGNVDDVISFHQSDSTTRRHSHNPNSWSASSSIKKPKEHLTLFPDVEFNNTIQVRCLKLDTWYNNNLKSQIVDFIWADVNGGEEELILGGVETLSRRVRFLYIEFSDRELYENSINKEKILELLPDFELIDTYNFQGNFGNVLLKNKLL